MSRLGSRGPLTAAVVLSALATHAATAAPVPERGVDCACLFTGAFTLPESSGPAVPPDAVTGLSATGRYRVTAVPGPGLLATVTVTDVFAGNIDLLRNLEGMSWGFSPYQDRFFVLAPSAAAMSLEVYDLEATPPAKVVTIPLSGLSSSLSFSSAGRWVVDLQATGALTFSVRVLDANTMALVHANTFTVEAFTNLAAVLHMGFGRGTNERTFAYWFAGSATSADLLLVNLETQAQNHITVPLGVMGYQLQFSPCGDRMVMAETVYDSTANAWWWDLVTYDTLTVQQAGVYTIPYFAVPSYANQMRTSASSLLAVMTDQSLLPIAVNDAGNACPLGAPPVAILVPPGPAVGGVAVSLTEASTAGDTPLVSWAWTFGDGATFTTSDPATKNPAHTFAAGTYTVGLTVTDAAGQSASATETLAVAVNQPPAASFTLSPPAPVARDLVTFTDTSTDDDGVVYAFWSVDGAQSPGSTATSRLCPGTHTITLTVTDHLGQSATATQQLVIAPPASADVAVAGGADLVAAAAATCAGDRLVLGAGDFTGGVTLTSVGLTGAGIGSTRIGPPATGSGYVLELSPGPGDTLTVSAVTIQGGDGGVRVRGDGDVSLDHLEVAHATQGGGVWVEDQHGSVAVTASSIHHNTLDSAYVIDNPGGPGGGIGMRCCGDLSVTGTEVAFNTSVSGEGGGVGLWDAASVRLDDVDVHDNVALTRGGGLALMGQGSAEVRLSRFAANTAAGDGGAIAIAGPTVITGTLVARNGTGGVLDAGVSADLTMYDDTVADNGPFGLRSAAPVAVWNTIVTGHTLDLVGPAPTGSGNLVGGSAGFSGDADYHLAAGSPAIDRGVTSAVPASLTTDHDGDNRVIDYKGAGAVVDIGWDEAVPPPPPSGGGGSTPPPPPHRGCGQTPGAANGVGLLVTALLLLAGRARRRRSNEI